MGAQASKTAETRVYLPETPVNFENKLIAQIENSNETDFARTQKVERYLEEKVSGRLSELERDVLLEFETKLGKSILPEMGEDKEEISGVIVKEKVEKLEERLKKVEQAHKVRNGESVGSARQILTECLLKNKEKALNCYEEVEQFKKAVFEV